MAPTYDQLINGDDAYVKRVAAAYELRHGHPPGITDQAAFFWKLVVENRGIESVLKEILGDLYQEPSLPPPTPFDVRPLHIEGTRFVDDTGATWQWRGYSWFLGYRRYLAGEDVVSDLRWLKARGFNLVRVFGPLPWVETPDYRYETFDISRLGDFFALLAAEGFYCEFVIGCYAFGNVGEQRQFAQRCFNIASAHPNVLIEAVNEPSVGPKPEPVKMLEGVDRFGVLASYGIYQPYYTSANDPLPMLDYVTIHTSRDSAWHRKARHAQELQHATGKPTISDEPAKITEPGFSYPGGKNDPIFTLAEMVWHAAICAMYTPGCTVHTEAGKWGQVPTPDMLQHAVIGAVASDVWDRIGPDWQGGAYKGGHSSGSPVDGKGLQIAGDDIWTYSSVHSNKAQAVRCAFSEPKAINGWRVVDAWGPGNSLVRLER